MPQTGAQIYAANCAGCHSGNGMNPTFPGAPVLNPNGFTLGQITTQVNTGGNPGGMPAFGDDGILTPAEVAAVAAFVNGWSV